MAEIELTQGHRALVDDADVEMLQHFAWSAHISSGGKLWYARAVVALDAGTYVRKMMHTFLTGWPQVDHINGNGLDNRRVNLRPSTRTQNMGNRRKWTVGSSRFKGVSWFKEGKRWKAQIRFAKKHIYLGLFDDEEAAARAYDAAARGYFGEFAAVNFPAAGERCALAAGGAS